MSRQVWLGFGLYCLVAGSTWLASAYLTTTWPELLRLAVHDAVLCMAFCLVSIARGERCSFQTGTAAAIYCGFLFAGASFTAAGAGASVSVTTQVLIFTLVPVVTVFLMGQREETADGLRMLVPVLAGAAGLALLLPFEWPTTGMGWGWFAALVACAVVLAVAAIRLRGLLRMEPLFLIAALGSGAASLLAGLGWRFFQSGSFEVHTVQVVVELLWAIVIDGMLVLLILWLVKRLNPVSLSVRFLFVPWVTIVGGLIMMRPSVGWMSLIGLLLTLGTGTYVLISNSEA